MVHIWVHLFVIVTGVLLSFSVVGHRMPASRTGAAVAKSVGWLVLKAGAYALCLIYLIS